MALKRRAPASAPSDMVKIPNLKPGEYEARLVYVADLGLQEGMTWKGVKKKDAQQIALGLEILGETIEMVDGEVPRVLWTSPFNIFLSLNEKGRELAYYSVFDPSAEDGGDADWDAQLGKACAVTVNHVSGKGEHAEDIYDNVQAVTRIPEKYQDNLPDAVTMPFVGDADDEGNPCTRALYGLPRYVLGKRIDGNKDPTAEGAPTDAAKEEDVPY